MSEPVIELAPKYLAAMTKILRTELEHLDAEVFMFGSRVRGTARTNSDIDIAISSDINLFDIIERLRLDFEDSDIPYKIDIVDLGRISDSFKSAIKKDLVKIPFRE
ncbi:MAG: nucleotidyltransferase domain-containing protein [Elusimicrobiaceae bacterium]|jgi:predicted nucleotidyltransferase